MATLPHEKYIKVLITRKLALPYINTELNELLLQEVTSKVFDDLYKSLYNTNADYFDSTDPNLLPDEQWLKDQGIFEVYAYKYNYPLSDSNESKRLELSVPGALQILNDPLMRRAIQALSIAGSVPEEDIELIINGKYDITYISENFSLFIKYFFDVKEWSLAQKRAYVKKLPASQEIFRPVYVIALTNDKNYLLWKLGLAPDKSFDQMLRDLATDAYYNCKERSHDPDSALKWGTLMTKIMDRLDKFDEDTQDKNDLYKQLTINLEQEKAYDKIITNTQSEEMGIEIPQVAFGDSPAVETLETLMKVENDPNNDDQV